MNGAPDFSLHGRVAVVTGGNGGLGLGMATALRSAGASVVVTGRDPAKNAAVPESLDVRGMDVRDERSVADLFLAVARDYGRLDVLVNNAGVYLDNPVADEPRTHWDEMIAVNLSGAMRCAHHAAVLMSEQRSGKIINVGSVYSVFGHPMSVGYAASKSGVVGLTRALAVELGPRGIQSNVILPGWFPTAMNGDVPAQERGAEIRRRTPGGRWGACEDLAGVVVFLASPASDFVSGAAIPVDGGYLVADRHVYD